MTAYLDHSVDLAELADVFDETSLWCARFGDFLLRNLELRSLATALDVGCGSGFPLFELAGLHGSRGRWFGVDVWPEALRRAARKRRIYDSENVALVRANGGRLPFRDATFDLIVSNLGVNNFEDAPRAIAECHRVCRPDARLVLSTNTKGHYAELYDAYRRVLDRLGREDWRRRLDAQEDHRVTEKSLSHDLESAGFVVTRVVRDAFTMRYLDGSALLNHTLVRYGFLDGWRGVVEAAHERDVFRALEEGLDRIARDEGELVMTVPMLYVEARRGEEAA